MLLASCPSRPRVPLLSLSRGATAWKGSPWRTVYPRSHYISSSPIILPTFLLIAFPQPRHLPPHHSLSRLSSRHLLPPRPPPRPLPLPPHHLTPTPLAVLQARRPPRQRPRLPFQYHVLHAVHPALFDLAPSARQMAGHDLASAADHRAVAGAGAAADVGGDSGDGGGDGVGVGVGGVLVARVGGRRGRRRGRRRRRKGWRERRMLVGGVEGWVERVVLAVEWFGGGGNGVVRVGGKGWRGSVGRR